MMVRITTPAIGNRTIKKIKIIVSKVAIMALPRVNRSMALYNGLKTITVRMDKKIVDKYGHTNHKAAAEIRPNNP